MLGIIISSFIQQSYVYTPHNTLERHGYLMKKITLSSKILISAVAIVGIAAVVVIPRITSSPKTITNYEPQAVYEFEETQTQTYQESSVSKGIKIPGYSNIPVTAHATEVSVDLVNPDENEVYFQISFYLADTNELIYQSKLISPGQHLYSIELERGLEAGEYPLTIQYDTFSMDGSFTPKNGASVNCFLTVS